MARMRRTIAITGAATALILAASSVQTGAEADDSSIGHQVGKLTALAEICGYRGRARAIQSKYDFLPDFEDSLKYWRGYWGTFDQVHGPCGVVKDLADELIDMDLSADGNAG